jgi:hypothetical protein
VRIFLLLLFDTFSILNNSFNRMEEYAAKLASGTPLNSLASLRQ